MERANSGPGRLLGRDRELAGLDSLLEGAISARGAALVIRGEPGIGKTALLTYVRDQAQAKGCRIVQVDGVEAEAELPYGGLHQLCSPFRGYFDRLPEPQRHALETAFGLRAGSPPSRFLVGLATLSLLAAVAEEHPLVCLVDDLQWIDQISVQTLLFVARRILAEPVLLLFTVRPLPGHPAAGLPLMELDGLGGHDALTLLTSVTAQRFDDRVRDRILAEARGNPLALIELPRGLTASELAGEGSWERAVPGRVEVSYVRRLRALTADTQRLLLLAAAEPVGDLLVLRRAAEASGINFGAAASEAEAADLLTFRNLARFRHPLVRSATYRSAAPSERMRAHQVLADVTDPDHDPDRRAWHLASATSVADEDVAAGLQEAAGRAQARGGVAAAAAFLGRSAELTPDPTARGHRAVAAAHAKCQAGVFADALDLLDAAELTPLDARDRARVDLIRGQIMFASHNASTGLPLLLSAANRLRVVDPALARETYRDALYAAFTAGQLPGGEGLEDVSAAIIGMGQAEHPSRSDLLLEGVARAYTEGYGTAAPLVSRALAAYRAEPVTVSDLGWLPLACRMAHNFWDFETWTLLSTALVDIAREIGAVSVLAPALLLRISNRVYAGDLSAASALVHEAVTIGDVIGSNFFARYSVLVVTPWTGSEAATRAAINAVLTDPALSTEGKALTATEWAAAVLYNGMERWEEAFTAAGRGAAHPKEMGLATWSMVELVEAASRLGRLEEATAAAAAVIEIAEAAGTPWALGTASLMRAQVSGDDASEEFYQEAIKLLTPTGVDMEVARAHLLYGEWLLRLGRSEEAHVNLRLAHDLLVRMGATGFVERARHSLGNAGVPHIRPPGSSVEWMQGSATETSHQGAVESLTPQETRIARLAAEGLTNPEIGTQLYLSSHTVEWHLRKVFAKLGIRSRREIAAVLAGVRSG
jgi:DNA-binding CsgD family transcriptional regulator/tetratricopeptide (TPR) repeat protein